MNLKSAARALGVHYQTAYKWVRAGELVAVKIGGSYDISEAALEQFRARRAALIRSAQAAAEGLGEQRDDLGRPRVLALLSHMIERIDVDASPVWRTATRLAAETVGDSAVLALRTPAARQGEIVAFHHPDPERLTLVGSIIADGVRPGSPSFGAQTLETGDTTHIRNVSQKAVRQMLRPEYHQHLDEVGIYSAISTPVRHAGEVTGALSVFRDKPGNPYSDADRFFMESVAVLVSNALETEQARRAAWSLRRDLKRRLEPLFLDADVTEDVAPLADVIAGLGESASAALLTPTGRVLAATLGYAEAHGRNLAELVGRRIETLLEFTDGEREVEHRERLRTGELGFAERTRELRGGHKVRVFECAIRRPDATIAAIVETATAANVNTRAMRSGLHVA